MKKFIILFIICLLFPAYVTAQEEIKLLKVQFYEWGDNPSEREQRKYETQFPKSKARYIWCEVEVENLLYKKYLHTHKIGWKYYNPDGSLRGEITSDWNIIPDWYTTWHQGGWGFKEPGNWPLGTYRVDILLDGQRFAEGHFTVYDAGLSTKPLTYSAPTIDFKALRFFEGGLNPPEKKQRLYDSRFSKKIARYVYYEIDVRNLLWNIRDNPVAITARYYKPDGSLFGEPVLNYTIPRDWETVYLWHSWGWDAPGNWGLGTYRVELIVSNKKIAEGQFTIYDDSRY